jgi:hypothetical protein
LERAVIQYQIDNSPLHSGGLRQRASEMDAEMIRSRFGWKVYQVAKSIGVGLYIHYAGYKPLAQNH